MPFVPTYKANLTIAKRLRQAASSPALLCQCGLLALNGRLFLSINWDLPATKHSAQHWNTAFDFLSLNLPTATCCTNWTTHASDRTSRDRQMPPACLHIVETDWHVLGCPRRSIWRESPLEALANSHQINHTQPYLTLVPILKN